MYSHVLYIRPFARTAPRQRYIYRSAYHSQIVVVVEAKLESRHPESGTPASYASGPNAVQSIVRGNGSYLAKQVKSDTWRIVGRPCGQFHG